MTAVTADARRVFRAVLARPRDWGAMLALADALEESGQDSLARAYRWASRRRRWPFAREMRPSEFGVGFVTGWGKWMPRVMDWDRNRKVRTDVPWHAKLPKYLFRAIVLVPRGERRYGGVHRAFVLLAQGLDQLNREKAADAPAGGGGHA